MDRRDATLEVRIDELFRRSIRDDGPGCAVGVYRDGRVDVARGWRLEAGFTEGLKSVSATTDFGVMVGLERAIRPRRAR